MSILLKNSAGNLLKTISGKLLTLNISPISTYTLEVDKSGGNLITLPNGANLLIDYYLDDYDGRFDKPAPRLSFSADFDLIIVTQGDLGLYQWGTYELYGVFIEEPIYIYDHNNYEHGMLSDDAYGSTALLVTDRYTPIARLQFNTANNILTVRPE